MAWHAVRGSLSREEYDRKYTDQQLFKRILPYLFSQKRLLLMVVILSLLQTIVSLGIPFMFAYGIDQLLVENPQLELIYIFAVSYLVLLLIEWVIQYLYSVESSTLRSNLVFDLRRDIFYRINQHDLSFFDRNKTGKIMARVSGDTFSVGGVMLSVVDLSSVILRAGLILITLLLINAELTIISLIVFPILFTFVFLLRKVMRKYSLLQRRAESSINAAVEESINGISITKSFGQEESAIKSYKDLQKIKVKVNTRQSTIFRSFQPFIELITALALFIILYFGGVNTVNGVLSFGFLYLFYTLLQRLFGPLIELSTFYANLQGGFAAGERMFSMMDVPTQMKEGHIKIDRIEGDIDIRNLNFGYDTKKGNVLKDINLHIPKGQTLAVVGETGAGKTSFVSVLSRMYEFFDGEIIIDNKYNIQELDADSVRNEFGYVLQDPFLFSGTILDNLLLGSPSATEQTIEKAIVDVGANSFIDLLPERLLTPVKERGKGFSQGQKQLLALARILVKDPKILILDEATSSVDVYTEKMIQDALNLVFKDRTTIIIAHRLSTILNADRIIVFDNGRIIEDGKHDELISKNGKYRELYETYYAHQGAIEQLV